MSEHLDEITTMIRDNLQKAQAYDAEVERKNAIIKAEERVNKHKANVEELRRRLDAEMVLMTEAESERHRLKNSD
jgi:hypothetical protein